MTPGFHPGWDSPRLKALDHLYGELPVGCSSVERTEKSNRPFPVRIPHDQTPYAARGTPGRRPCKLLGIFHAGALFVSNGDQIVFEAIDPVSPHTPGLQPVALRSGDADDSFWDELSDPADWPLCSRNPNPEPPSPPRSADPTRPPFVEGAQRTYTGPNTGS